MALVKPVAFQIVGFQNSGKTTLSTQILNRLNHKGFKVVSIKHHGHGGKPEVCEQKDSALHVQYGSRATIVEGNGRLLLQAEKDNWTLSEKMGLMEFFKPDLILIEGYKKENYPKLVIIKDEKDRNELLSLENIQFIMVWDEKIDTPEYIPCFPLNNEIGLQQIVEFLENQICSKN